MKDLWPLTVSRTRYQGVYEGGDWIAFHLLPEDVPHGPWGDDLTCVAWFGESKVAYGVGATPAAAIESLEYLLDD